MRSFEALNTLEMTVRETIRRTMDCSQGLEPAERIIGISSISLSPGNGPVVSGAGYSQDGKSISFTLSATAGTTVARQYTVTALLSVKLADVTETIEAQGTLLVLS